MSSVMLSGPAFRQLVRQLSASYEIVQLETQDEGHSLLAVGTQASLCCRKNECTLTREGNSDRVIFENPWNALRSFREEYSSSWSFGYLGYDLKNHLEKLESKNPDPVVAPDLWMMCPKWVMRYDASTCELEFVYKSVPFPTSIESLSEVADTEQHIGSDAFTFSLKPQGEAHRLHYLDIIKQAQQDIFEGNYYEINLSRQLVGTYSGEPYHLYEQMRKRGPVPFAAFLRFGDWKICCSSPERFLQKRGNVLLSQPIKGTAAVIEDEEENAITLQNLRESEKNRAENLMIVDLVRHDFSTVCVPGSVRVPELFRIHRFPTVYQMISTVQGELNPQVDPVSAIAACFPMGSMTGAPKISAMRAIERLEDYRRGIYSGAIGYFTPDGDFDFNVVIRSAVCHKNTLSYCTGGAITNDSDPQEEWEETRIKTRALSGQF